MSTAKQAPKNKAAARTDAAHAQQKNDPGEGGNIRDGRIERPTPQGRGVDETGKDSKAPHEGA